MKKKAIFYVLLIVWVFLFSTTNVYAKEETSYKNNENYIINLQITDNIQSLGMSLVQVMDCEGQNTILGNVNDQDSVAWLLQKILNYLRVLGPFLVLILSSLDYLKSILSSDDKGLNESHKRLITRLLLAGALFVLPTLVSVLLNLLGFMSTEVCGFQ